MPEEREVRGILALLLANHARRATRTTEDGRPSRPICCGGWGGPGTPPRTSRAIALSDNDAERAFLTDRLAEVDHPR